MSDWASVRNRTKLNSTHSDTAKEKPDTIQIKSDIFKLRKSNSPVESWCNMCDVFRSFVCSVSMSGPTPKVRLQSLIIKNPRHMMDF